MHPTMVFVFGFGVGMLALLGVNEIDYATPRFVVSLGDYTLVGASAVAFALGNAAVDGVGTLWRSWRRPTRYTDRLRS